jgi:hypothetical protein
MIISYRLFTVSLVAPAIVLRSYRLIVWCPILLYVNAHEEIISGSYNESSSIICEGSDCYEENIDVFNARRVMKPGTRTSQYTPDKRAFRI